MVLGAIIWHFTWRGDTPRGGAALCYWGPPIPMDLWKLYRKHCAALFLQDKDPGSQQTRPRRHFDLASPHDGQ